MLAPSIQNTSHNFQQQPPADASKDTSLQVEEVAISIACYSRDTHDNSTPSLHEPTTLCIRPCEKG